MNNTQTVTISGFLILSLITLIAALWLFSRFLFTPLRHMITDMGQMRNGNLDVTINNKDLSKFYILADTL